MQYWRGGRGRAGGGGRGLLPVKTLDWWYRDFAKSTGEGFVVELGMYKVSAETGKTGVRSLTVHGRLVSISCLCVDRVLDVWVDHLAHENDLRLLIKHLYCR